MEYSIDIVLKELELVFESSDFSQSGLFIDEILAADKIILFGAGRVGLIMKCFSIRLNHLGINSYFLGDSNVPKTGEKDLLIVGSGSGNTLTVTDVTELAITNKLTVISITANASSFIATNSKYIIKLNTQTKSSINSGIESKQPMTTLFEQSLLLTVDALVLMLIKSTGQTNQSLGMRHNNIE